MAISLGKMREELTTMLEETLAEEYDPGWAVYADYSFEDMSWRIGKVERWNYGKHDKQMREATHRVIRVYNCRDEIDAYMKAKKQLEQTE